MNVELFTAPREGARDFLEDHAGFAIEVYLLALAGAVLLGAALWLETWSRLEVML